MKTFEDLLTTYPDNVQKKLENEHVLVLAVMLAPGELLPEHQHEARIVCALTDYTLTVNQSGNSAVHSFRTGDVHWHDAGDTHAVTNTGTTEARFIVTIIKDATHE